MISICSDVLKRSANKEWNGSGGGGGAKISRLKGQFPPGIIFQTESQGGGGGRGWRQGEGNGGGGGGGVLHHSRLTPPPPPGRGRSHDQAGMQMKGKVCGSLFPAWRRKRPGSKQRQ